MKERGSIPLAVFILLGLFILVMAGLFGACDALFHDDDEPGDLGHARLEIQLVSHNYDDGGDRSDQDYDNYNGSRDDRNRNRNRNRGAFSPGPFDDSPVDAFNGNVICLPGSTCYSDDRQRQDPPPEEQQP